MANKVGRPKIYNDVTKLQKDVEKYFKLCDEEKKPYTVSGLALALNMDRRSLLNYSKDEKFFPTIKMAKQKIEAQLEENALMNKCNPTFTIFNLKNNFNWKDNMQEREEEKDIQNAKDIVVKIREIANNDK